MSVIMTRVTMTLDVVLSRMGLVIIMKLIVTTAICVMHIICAKTHATHVTYASKTQVIEQTTPKMNAHLERWW